MNNTNPPDPEQAAKPPDRPHATPGMMLRKARESANISHAAVSETLYLTVHYIKALENDDYKKLPGATFVKGYLRAYSRYLKLDANAVLASYERNFVSEEELNGRIQSSPRNQKRHDQTFRWAVVTAVIIVLGVAAGWWFVGKDQSASTAAMMEIHNNQQQVDRSQATIDRTVVRTSTTRASYTGASASTAGASSTAPLDFTQSGVATAAFTSAAATPALTDKTDTDSVLASGIANQTGAALVAVVNPVASMVLSELPAAGNAALMVTPTAEGAKQITLISSGTDMLQLYFEGTSWIEIDDGAEGRLFNDTLAGGDAVTLHGTAPFNILLGDATQVELSYNSEPINLASQIRNDKTARFSVGAAVVPVTASLTSQGINR